MNSDIHIFLKRVLVFVLIGITLIPGFFYLKYYEKKTENLIGFEVYHALKKSKQKKTGVKVLILGDSVGKQCYDIFRYNDSIYSLATFQAVSLAGHYILLHNFLETYENPENVDIVLLIRPSSFRNDLHQQYTFNYFMKPFYKKEYEHLLSDYTKAQIQDIPFHNTIHLPIVRKSTWSPHYMMGKNKPNDFSFSRLSAEYILKIAELCDRKNVKSMKIICPFMSDEFCVDDFKEFNESVQEYGLEEYFTNYYDKLVFLDHNLFSDDIHLKNDSILTQDFLDFSN